jgi:hypothetical protein
VTRFEEPHGEPVKPIVEGYDRADISGEYTDSSFLFHGLFCPKTFSRHRLRVLSDSLIGAANGQPGREGARRLLDFAWTRCILRTADRYRWLVPQDANLRAEVRAVSELINSAIQPMHNIAVRQRLED